MFCCKICHHNPIVLMTQSGKWFVTCSNYKCSSHNNETVYFSGKKQDVIDHWQINNPYINIYQDTIWHSIFMFKELSKPIYVDTQTDKRDIQEIIRQAIINEERSGEK